ncbi:MAG: hypothetical protein HGA44_13020 [Cellulomonadaceae bacterium]|nr:hypothetical protein [Cellulomonadaceae bacterium]
MGDTNMVASRPTRPRLRAGDIFSVQYLPGRFIFGRIVLADAPAGPMPNSNLVYLYSTQGQDESNPPDSDELTTDRLLFYPFFTNRLGWTRGFFHTVGFAPITPDLTLEQYEFYDPAFDHFVDENGVRIHPRGRSFGVFGLASYRWVDDRIAEALGHPPAPIGLDD